MHPGNYPRTHAHFLCETFLEAGIRTNFVRKIETGFTRLVQDRLVPQTGAFGMRCQLVEPIVIDLGQYGVQGQS